MSVELTIETVEETIVLELQDRIPAVLTIDNIPELRDELESKVDAEVGMGLSELSFTTVDKLSLDQSEQDRHTHNNKPVIDGLSDDAGVLQYKGLPISDQAALDAKVDKVAGKSLVDDAEIAKLVTVQENATENSTDADLRDRDTHTGVQAISTVTGLQGALDSKVDKDQFSYKNINRTRWTENIFNEFDITNGSTLDASGLVQNNGYYYITGFIKVNPLSTYYYTESVSDSNVCFYNANKILISCTAASNSVFTPEGSEYIRISHRTIEKPPSVFMVSSSPLPVKHITSNTNYPVLDGLNGVGNGFVGLDEYGYIEEESGVKGVFNKGSALYKDKKISPRSILDLKIWARSSSDEFYLNSLYRFYPIFAGASRAASIGFKRKSDGAHISPALAAPNKNPALYSFWEVAVVPVGIQQLYLYLHGDSSTLPVGYVTVNWDSIPATSERYIGTDQKTTVNNRVIGKAFKDIGVTQSINPVSAVTGKKIVAIGDSVTAGFIPRNSPGYPGVLASWLPQVAALLDASFVNYGSSGSTLGDNGTGSNNPFTKRYSAMANDADIVIVMGGTNDFRKSVPIGSMSDRADTTFYGALHVLCAGLIDKYQIQQGLAAGKNKKIILFTPLKIVKTTDQTLDLAILPFVSAVKEVGAYYSLPVLDLYSLSNINPHILQSVVGTEAGYTGNYNPYITDGTHPTEEGHAMIAKVVSGFLKSLY